GFGPRRGGFRHHRSLRVVLPQRRVRRHDRAHGDDVLLSCDVVLAQAPVAAHGGAGLSTRSAAHAMKRGQSVEALIAALAARDYRITKPRMAVIAEFAAMRRYVTAKE